MEKFERYLAAFDGSTDWRTIAPLFDDAFHDDAVFVTADAELDKVQWAAMAKGLREKGSVISDFEVTEGEGDSIYYKVTVTPAGGHPMHLAARGTLKDGQLLRVEPVDPAAYSEMVQRSS